MSETINIPRDTTMQLLVKVHRDQIAGEMDLKYKEKVAAATSKAEVDALFTDPYLHIPRKIHVLC